MRQKTFNYLPKDLNELIQDDIVTDGVSVNGFLFVQVTINNESGEDITVKIMGATIDPTGVINGSVNFKQPAGLGNSWDFIDCYPLNNQASGPIVGSTGIQMLSTEKCKMFTVSVDDLDRIAFDVEIANAPVAGPGVGVQIRVTGVTNQ